MKRIMDSFFTKQFCDRCGKPLTVRIMSMYNEDVICPECKDAETKRPDYASAVAAEHAEVKKGNYNFKGIGRGGDK